MLEENNIKSKARLFAKRNYFIATTYRFLQSIKFNFSKLYSDEKRAKFYSERKTGKKLNLSNPKTFNEKLVWLKLNNRNPLLTICTDKYEVRSYIKECGLENILNDLYGVYDKAEDINFNNLPEKAFIKTNHGSFGGIAWDKNTPFDKQSFIVEFNKLLKKNYYWYSREWNYKNIKPKIIIEKKLETDDSRGIVDYKFMCFDGQVKLLSVELDIVKSDGTKDSNPKRNFYDRNFNFVDVQMGGRSLDTKLTTMPDNFDDMIKYAEIISEPFPHCRVDLYNIDGKVIFGETTFYHGGCGDVITPEKYNRIMGDWIDIKSDKVVTNK